MPVHIKAEKEDIADMVIVGGDPARIEAMSDMLEDSKKVNANRGFLVYTGSFKGKRMTLACHGIGAPSIAIVVEELAELGAKYIVRFGTCGALDANMDVGDLVVVTGASYANGGTITQYMGHKLNGVALAQTPDFELTQKIVDALHSKHMKFHMANAYSTDSFYSLSEDKAKELAEYGNSVVEMEAATLFMLGRAKGVKTATLLMVSDNVIKHTKLFTHGELEEKVRKVAAVLLEVLSK